MERPIVSRAHSLNAAAWSTLHELVETFDGGGSFCDVVDRARGLLRARKMLRQAVKRQQIKQDYRKVLEASLTRRVN